MRFNLNAGESSDYYSTPSTSPFLIIVQQWGARSVYVGSEWGNEWRYSLIFGEDLISFNYSNYAVQIVNNDSSMVSVEIIRHYS